MDVIAGLLALLAGTGGVAGFLANQSAQQLLASQLDQAEVLEVRIQSSPNFRLLNGEADRLLIAGRGLRRQPFPRIDLLELETDPIGIDIGVLQGSPLQLTRPLGAAVRVVVRADDLNAALRSPAILSQFQNIRADLPFAAGSNQAPATFNLQEPEVKFLADNRVQLSAKLVEGAAEAQALDISFRAELAVESGQRLRLVDPELVVGAVRVPEEISSAFLGGLNEVFNLRDLERQGITARVLKLSIKEDLGTLEVIGFAQIERVPGSN